MYLRLPAIRTPIMIKAGAVTVVGITAKSGLKIIETKNRIPTKIAVKPVLPPIAIPALDSTEVPSGAVPNTDPSTIASESDKKAFPIRGILPFLSTIPACCVIPIKVPAVSKNVTSKNVKTTINSCGVLISFK